MTDPKTDTNNAHTLGKDLKKAGNKFVEAVTTPSYPAQWFDDKDAKAPKDAGKSDEIQITPEEEMELAKTA